MTTISIIGAPTDVGASVRGAGMGPDALRVAGLIESLEARNLTVIDHGNLHGPANPWQTPVNGFRHLQEAIAWNQSVFDAVSNALNAGQMPMMLGGDHCLAIGSISAIAEHCKKVGKNCEYSGLMHTLTVTSQKLVRPETFTVCQWPV